MHYIYKYKESPIVRPVQTKVGDYVLDLIVVGKSNFDTVANKSSSTRKVYFRNWSEKKWGKSNFETCLNKSGVTSRGTTKVQF